MNITTKFGIGDKVTVVTKARYNFGPHSDEANTGEIGEIMIEVDRAGKATIDYRVRFRDKETGEFELDWEEDYNEKELSQKEEKTQ
jgi:hypothetical protein